MMAGLISTCAFIILCCLSGRCFGSRKLLVFLIDGFRYDYIDELENMPGFREIVDNGVKVDYMTPDFPSLSFPNYYSLMTGRHCEVHQMTGNYMWDQTSLKEFNIGTNPDSRLPIWWEGSEPLWVTMQKLKKDVYMYYWPGCEVSILGVRPAFCEEYAYNPSVKNFTDAIEHALNALRGKVTMATVYYENIDVEGHHYGPQSPQVKTAILNLDTALQTLNKKIKEKNMQEDLNVIMFSDHGMTDIQWMEKVIELQLYINMSDIIKMMDRGPVVSLWPKPAKFESVYRSLSIARNMKVYKKPEIPQRFHYKGGKFVAALTLVADPGWFITESIAKLPYWQNGTGNGWQHGWHGYDNEFLDMRGFFLARGPGKADDPSNDLGVLVALHPNSGCVRYLEDSSKQAAYTDFKKNLKAAPIRTVDVYNLMCSVLGIQPLPNNGSWSRVEYMLSGAATQSPPFLLGTAASVLLPLVLTF